MRSIEEIKAAVRARLTARIAPPNNLIGVPFDHGDYLVEEILSDLVGGIKVLSFYDPTPGLPVAPTELDRYIASASGSGWTVNNLYTRIGADWIETDFAPGISIAYVVSEDEWYGAYSTGWRTLASGSSTQNPFYINEYVKISATGRSFSIQIQTEEGTWEEQFGSSL